MKETLKQQIRLLTILGAVAIVMLGIVGLAWPQFNDMQEFNEKRETLSETNDKAQAKNKDLQVKLKNIDEQQAKLAQLQAGFPDSSRQDEMIRSISDIMGQQGMFLANLEYGRPTTELVNSKYASLVDYESPVAKDGMYPLVAVPVNMSFSGQRESAFAAAESVSSLDRAFMIDELSIDENKQNQVYNLNIAFRSFVTRELALPGSENKQEQDADEPDVVEEPAPELTPEATPVPAPEPEPAPEPAG